MSLSFKMVICVLVCLGLGISSGFVGGSPMGEWYNGLNKPSFQPPAWLFGPAWTLLYTLIGISLALIWDRAQDGPLKTRALSLFGIQFILNLIWTPVFFGMENPLLALAIIIAMWFFILLTILQFKKIDQTASYLLYPYLLWVSFATLLNASIIYLN